MKQLLFSLLLFALGCSGGEISLEGNAGAGLKDIEVTMTFTVAKSTANTGTTVVATKADVVADAVQDLWIGQYNKNGELLICHYLNNISGNGNSITLQLKEAADCTIYFVANAGDLGQVANFATYQFAYASDGLSTPEGIPVSGKMPLYGSLTNQTVSVSYTSPTVELSRLLGKVQLSLTLGAGFDFTVTSVSLCNVPAAIQCKEPTGQASGMSYQTFSKTVVTPDVPGSPAVYEWYVPENKAGTITPDQEGYADDERHKCGGSFVPNATYIEIVGDIEVDNVTYSDVQFRLYPGENANDYSIKRNKPYDVSLTLTGIDFSDPRVSLTIPEMEPLVLGVQAGEKGSVQITARPGQEWSFTVPDWLSAQVGGDVFENGSTLTRKGPALVEFTTKLFNQYEEDRELTSTLGEQLSVKQSGAKISVSTEGFGLKSDQITVTINATEGLSWKITTTDPASPFTLSQTSGTGSSTIDVTVTEANSEVQLSGVQYQATVDDTNPVRSVPFLITQGLVWGGNKLYVNKANRTPPNGGGSFGNSYSPVIEIDSEDVGKIVYYNVPSAMTNCANRYGGTGWRLPTFIELVAMYHYKDALSALSNIQLGTNKKTDGYWSSIKYSSGYCSLLFQNGFGDWYDARQGMGGTKPTYWYRCVRTTELPKELKELQE